MKRYICWYAYKGMETEGKLKLSEPLIFDAEDEFDAMWQYHHTFTPNWGDRFYDGSLDTYRSTGDATGWGFNCEELAK